MSITPCGGMHEEHAILFSENFYIFQWKWSIESSPTAGKRNGKPENKVVRISACTKLSEAAKLVHRRCYLCIEHICRFIHPIIIFMHPHTQLSVQRICNWCEIYSVSI